MTRATRPADLPFFAYGRLFRGLSAPALGALTGDFEASFVGPAWFRSLSRAGVSMGGLPGWFGKRFDGEGQGMNLLRRDGALATVMPMEVRLEASRLDGAPVAAVHYALGTRLPWPYVIDELRVWEGSTLLGMTLLDVPGLRGVGLPFLLRGA
jgi:hypothetical protein